MLRSLLGFLASSISPVKIHQVKLQNALERLSGEIIESIFEGALLGAY